jgi:hypothetical protein
LQATSQLLLFGAGNKPGQILSVLRAVGPLHFVDKGWAFSLGSTEPLEKNEIQNRSVMFVSIVALAFY